MSNLLSLDQASHTSGWAFFQDGKLITYGKIVANQDDLGQRLEYIRNNISNLIEKYEIDEVIFEDIQLQEKIMDNVSPANVKVFKVLAEVFGVVEELLTEIGIPHSAVLSVSWKSLLNIKGRTRPEQKKNAQKYVVSNYGITATEDESDAICIGTYSIQMKNMNIHDWSN